MLSFWTDEFEGGSMMMFGKIDFILIYKGFLQFNDLILDDLEVSFPYIKWSSGKCLIFEGFWVV